MPLPAAQPLNSLGAVPITLPQMVQAPNLQLLTAGLQSGAINQGDLEDQLSKIAVRKHQQVQTAAAQEDLKSLPMRRQQEMQAGQQENQLRDLHIQTAQRQLSNPFLAAEQSNQAKDLADYDEATNYASKPLDKDGKIDWTAVRMTNRAAKQHQAEVENANKETLAGREQAHKIYQDNLGPLPKTDTGAIDEAAVDAGLKQFGPNKQVDAAALSRLASIDQANHYLDQLQQDAAHLPKSSSMLGKATELLGQGPIAGAIRQHNPYDAGGQAIQTDVDTAKQVVAHGVLGEGARSNVGQLAEAAAMIPSLKNGPEMFNQKMTVLRQKLAGAKQSILEEQAAAGRSTARFSGASAPTGAGAATTASPATTAPVVKSQADWDVLPKGATYQLPTGERYIKR